MTPNTDELAMRRSQRMTITVPYGVMSRLELRALEEGRSLSNLSAYLLERSVEKWEPGE
ncbi:MAG: hypothetical protein RLZZ106_286 [Cyanobacteriota bacterium]|jgi:hypothetical protein